MILKIFKYLFLKQNLRLDLLVQTEVIIFRICRSGYSRRRKALVSFADFLSSFYMIKYKSSAPMISRVRVGSITEHLLFLRGRRVFALRPFSLCCDYAVKSSSAGSGLLAFLKSSSSSPNMTASCSGFVIRNL